MVEVNHRADKFAGLILVPEIRTVPLFFPYGSRRRPVFGFVAYIAARDFRIFCEFLVPLMSGVKTTGVVNPALR